MILLVFFLSFFLGLRIFHSYAILFLIVSLIFLTFVFIRFKKKVLLFSLMFLSLGIGISFVRIPNNPKDSAFRGFVSETHENYYVFISGIEKFYIYEKANDTEVGDFYVLYATPHELDLHSIESQFDFKTYLSNKGIKRELNVQSKENQFSVPIRKKAIKENFLSNFDDETSAYLDALLFNVKDYDSPIIKNANSLNVIFLLSTSGVYLGLIMRALSYLFKLRFSDKISNLFVLILFAPYLLFAIDKVGIFRLLVVYFIKLINEWFLKKQMKYLSIISLSGFVILLFDYNIAYQEAFYVGYFASLFSYFSWSLYQHKKKILRVAISFILIFLFMLPIGLSSSHELHLLGFVFQLILLPINLIGMVFGIASFYSVPFTHILFACRWFVDFILVFFKSVDISVYVGDFSIYLSSLYYAIYLFSLYLFDIRYKKGYKISVSLLLITFLISIVPISQFIDESVSFIDVGQGDCALVSKGSHHFLIDTGGSLTYDIATDSLIPYFKRNKIYSLDAVLISHNDYDHSGALSSLQANFPIKFIYDNSSSYPLNLNGITFKNLNNSNHVEDNDNSAVLFFEFMSKKWLFTGDISTAVEDEIINAYQTLDIDYLKVSHHGSISGSSLKFLKQISPTESIISVGKNNRYGHPSDIVISRLQMVGSKIRRTDIEGTISYHRLAFNV